MNQCKPLLAGAFERWMDMVQDVKHMRFVLERAAKRMMNRRLQGSWESWWDAVELARSGAIGHGLTLVHFSAQPKPFPVTASTVSVHFSAQPETFCRCYL